MALAVQENERDVVSISCSFSDLFSSLVLILCVDEDDQRFCFVDGCLEGTIGDDLLVPPWLGPQSFLWSLVFVTAGVSTLFAAALADLPDDLVKLVDDLVTLVEEEMSNRNNRAKVGTWT